MSFLRQASLQQLEREGVLLLPGPALSSEAAERMLVELVLSWGRPHPHDASGQRSWVWDVLPQPDGRARSQGFDEFSLHTDASFEDPPPRFVALFVVQADEQGGGLSQWVHARDVLQRLPQPTRRQLREDHDLSVPDEFAKGRLPLRGPLVSGADWVRFRCETTQHTRAAQQLRLALQGPRHTQAMPAGSLLLFDNWRVFHGRTQILDPARHLKRVRFFGPELPPTFGVVRQLPQVPLPQHPYQPGRGPRPELAGPDPWPWALDLFNHGYYWEAHEVWEGLWQYSDKRSAEGLALRGLIQSAAACLKSLQGNQRGVNILSARATSTLASSGLKDWRGISLEELSRALSRLPERIYLRPLPPDDLAC